MFSSNMGMAAILFNGVEPFKQIINTLSAEGPMLKRDKIAQAVSEKTLKITQFYSCT